MMANNDVTVPAAYLVKLKNLIAEAEGPIDLSQEGRVRFLAEYNYLLGYVAALVSISEAIDEDGGGF